MFPISSNTDESGLYVDDVFSTWLYSGTGSTQTITNGIDLAGKGGMVWSATRVGADGNGSEIIDTVRGGSYRLLTATTQATYNLSDPITFNNNGFLMSGTVNSYINYSGYSKVAWTFRKAAKFFDVVTYTGTGAVQNIAHNLGVVPGMIIVKRTDTTSDWQVYSNGLTSAANSIQLNLTAAQASAPTVWNSTAPTSSVFSVGTSADVNASGGTYVAYLFAHDTSSTGIIQCGSYTGSTTVTLGWEPQYLLLKQVNSGSSGGWFIVDSMRGFAVDAAAYNGDAYLYANQSSAEVLSFGWEPTSTGFTPIAQDGRTLIYMAIRRPNKPPTLGTQVYNAIARTGTGAAATVTGVGFAPDFIIPFSKNAANRYIFDRLRGNSKGLKLGDIQVEYDSSSAAPVTFNQNGFLCSTDSFNICNTSATPFINWFFKRAPGFFDVVCYTGDGVANRDIPHSLGVIPELSITKSRNATGIGDADSKNWIVRSQPSGDGLYLLNTSGQDTSWGYNTYWPFITTWFKSSTMLNTGSPSLSQNWVNGLNEQYVAYLFATLAGISKVGSYTGNGGSQTISCGFAAGARFILIKRTSAAGDWYVWDTARGITTSAGNDPHLSLNTTEAEVTDDSIDSTAVGFIVKQIAATNINVTSATYMYLAIA